MSYDAPSADDAAGRRAASPRGKGHQAIYERATQLQLVREACTAAATAAGRTIVFRGPAGIGKTTLLQAAVGEAGERGFRTLSARGGEVERLEAFGVIRHLFAPTLIALSGAEHDELRRGPAREAVALVLGQDGSRRASDGVSYGLYWLLALLTQDRPIMVVIDDVHWADAPSLRFLEFLGRRVEELPVVVVVGLRSGQVPVDPAALDQLLEASGTVLEDVPALSTDAVHHMAAASYGGPVDEAFAAACRRATGGNPLFLGTLFTELVARAVPPSEAGVEQVSEFRAASLAGLLRERLSRLSPGAHAVATAAAILGHKASLRHVAMMTEMSMAAAAAIADGLASDDLLEHGEPLAFRHPILRMALLGALGGLERGMLHLRAANVLTETGGTPDEIAAHLLHAPGAGDERAVENLRAAARAATEGGAPDVAATYLQRAVDEPPVPDLLPAVLRDLGELQLASGDGRALETLQRAHAASVGADARARAALPLMHALVAAGRIEEALRVVSVALRDLGDRDRELSYMLEAEAAVWVVRDVPGGGWIVDRLERHAREVAGATTAERVLLANLAYTATLRCDRGADEVARIAEAAYANGLLLRDVGAGAPSFAAAVTALAHADRLELAQEAVDSGLAEARAAGSALAFGYVSVLQAGIAERLGYLAEMEAAARAALDLAVANGWRQLMPMALHFLPCALIERDGLDEAEALLACHGYGPADPPDPTPPTWTRALVRIRRGRYAQALDDLFAARAQGAWWMEGNLMPWRAEAARALLALGRTEEARTMASEELDLARRWGTRRAEVLALRAAALVFEDDALDLLSEAIDISAGANADLERAKALLDIGRVLRQRNRRGDAREPLEQAVDLAARCGAIATLRVAEAELAATGAPARRTASVGPASLTATQRRLAEMAASGMTNKQIAQELFVSLKTVESHLAAAYRKLGVSSRTELRAALDAGPPARIWRAR